jgi:PKD repeat protein
LVVPFGAAGLAIVQGWVSDPASNHGLVIADPDTSDGADFHSSESATAMARPKLEVTYRVPVEPPPNLDPVAGFDFACTFLDCDFTDTSTDADGSISAWHWSFGDGGVADLQNPNHVFATAGTFTVTLTVTDDDGGVDAISRSVSVSAPPAQVDHLAQADLPGAGTVSGTFTNTHDDDGVAQGIQERESGGRKGSRYSYLEHGWQFQVGATTTLTVIANAWSGGSSDGDAFRFEWAAGSAAFQPLFTVSSTSPGNLQSAMITAGGTVTIRVVDTDATPGHTALDTVLVDQLILRADNTVPENPPATPIGLQVTSASSDSLTLAWQHDGTNEQGFELQRSPAGTGAWADVASPAGGSTAYTNSGLPSATAFDYRIRAWNAAGESTWSNIATGVTSAAPAITLSVNGYKVKGSQVVDLAWSGAASPQVDIVRDGVVVATVATSAAAYTDAIGAKGSATYVYRVCEAGTSVCSDDQVVVF